MKVVVFGGSGFLGSHVADILSQRGFNVYIYDIKHSPYLKSSQIMVLGDILDRKLILETVKDADYIYHFAGIADIQESSAAPLGYPEYQCHGYV